MPNVRTTVVMFAAIACAWTVRAHAERVVLADAANLPASTSGVAAHLRAQTLLARANFSPGEIDGLAGSNQRRAVSGYQAAHDLPPTGELDADTWAALNKQAPAVVTSYTLTEQDVGQAFAKLPKDMMEQGKLGRLGFESIEEALGERFHASPALLRQLNPGTDFSRAIYTDHSRIAFRSQFGITLYFESWSPQRVLSGPKSPGSFMAMAARSSGDSRSRRCRRA